VDHPLAEPLRHHAWATLRLLEACRTLTPDQLAATVPGTYGSVRATCQHLLGAEAFYQRLLTSRWPAWRWPRHAAPSDLAVLEAAARESAAFWAAFLAEPYDPDRRVVVPDPDEPASYDVAVGVIVTQALDHGPDHRSQVATILSSLGIAPPALDAWAYGRAHGRVIPRPGDPPDS
jgi:uncharacterized damage-inducible protein DinB